MSKNIRRCSEVESANVVRKSRRCEMRIRLGVVLLAVLSTLCVGDHRLIARYGETISVLEITNDRRRLNFSITVQKPVSEIYSVALAVDAQNKTSFYTLHSELFVARLDGTGTARRYEVGLVLEDAPTAIAYDWLTKKIYIAITTASSDHPARIQACDWPSGTALKCSIILHTGLDSVQSLVLDMNDGNMYWVNYVHKRIEKAFLNGKHHDTNPFITAIEGDSSVITSLALNSKARSIFYVRDGQMSGGVYTCKLYDRRSCTRILKSAHVMTVGVLQEFLFISYQNGVLESCEAEDCERTRIQVSDMNESVETFIVIDKSLYNASKENVCGRSNGGCSHLCIPSEVAPQVSCFCPPGIQLKNDGRTCEERVKEALLISSSTGLFYVSLDVDGYMPLPIPYPGHETPKNSLFDIDYDPVEGFIYWMDLSDLVIRRCRLDGSDVKTIIMEGLTTTTKTFRLDISARNIYWVDDETSFIWVGRMDNSVRPRVITGNAPLSKPHAVAIDYKNAHLYVTESADYGSAIIRFNMDGGDPHVVFRLENRSQPQGIDVDTKNGRVYWAESNHLLIRSVKLDGTDLSTYMREGKAIPKLYSLSKLGNRVFCNALAGRSIIEVTLKDGALLDRHSTNVFESQVYGPMSMRAVRFKPEHIPTGPCTRNNGGCEHYCFAKPSGGVQCACSLPYVLFSDGRRCSTPFRYALFVNQSLPTDVQFLSLSHGVEDTSPAERLYLTGLRGTPVAVDYDQVRNIVVIASKTANIGVIQVLSLTNRTSGSVLQTLVEAKRLKFLVDISIDDASRLVYWSNSIDGKIEAVSLDGGYSMTVAWSKLVPRRIAAHRTEKVIAYTNRNDEGQQVYIRSLQNIEGPIMRISMSENEMVDVAVDNEHSRLYWAEKNSTEGSYVNYVGLKSDQSDIHTQFYRGITVRTLQYSENMLYFSDMNNGRFGLLTESGAEWRSAAGITSFAIVEEASKSPPPISPCATKKGGCQQLCSVSMETLCQCVDHFSHDNNGDTCLPARDGILIGTTDRILLVKTFESKSAWSFPAFPAIAELPIDRVGMPLSIAVDNVSKLRMLYWIDGNDPSVLRASSLANAKEMITVSLNVPPCTKLRDVSVDPPSRQLFIACTASHDSTHIVAFRIQEIASHSYDRLLHVGILINGDNFSPLTQARPVPTRVTSSEGRLAYLDTGARKGKTFVIVCNLDGQSCKRVSENASTSSALSSISGRGYFSAAEGIVAFDMHSLQELTLNEHPRMAEKSGKAPLFGVFSDAFIVYSVMGGGRGRELEMHGYVASVPRMDRPTAIATFQANTEMAKSSCSKSECSHLCSTQEGKQRCWCPFGYSLHHDSDTSCIEDVNCKAYEFLCTDRRTCVHQGRLCDGKVDCFDGSDEASEQCRGVSEKHWKCANGRETVDRYRLCDGNEDCLDGSDEANCACNDRTYEMDCALFGRMREPLCIPREKRCDKHVDCPNRADEDELICEQHPARTFSQMLLGYALQVAVIVLTVIIVVGTVAFYWLKRRNRRDHSDRRYIINGNHDASVLAPLNEDLGIQDTYEMQLRAFSMAGSSTTYPSLPPPAHTLSEISGRPGYAPQENAYAAYIPHSQQQRQVLPENRFYAPPPSMASLSTYGVVPVVNGLSTIRSDLPSHLSYSTLSPVPSAQLDKRRRGGSRDNFAREAMHSGSGSSRALRSGNIRPRDRHDSDSSAGGDTSSLSTHSSDREETPRRNL